MRSATYYIQLDNITDLMKLRPNFCPKVDQEVKIIVKVKIIAENNIPTCIFKQSLSFHDFKISYRLNVDYLDCCVLYAIIFCTHH